MKSILGHQINRRYTYLLFWSIFILVDANSQSFMAASDLENMIKAENSFIQMAKNVNTRDAFLEFLSDDAIIFGKNGPVKAKESYKKQTANNGWLNWQIAYSDIAGSGDLGFNTGPWEYRMNKTDSSAVAFGEFNSIWKKQPDGSWKNILDIGIDHSGPYVKQVSHVGSGPVWKKDEKAFNIETLKAKEMEFQQAVLKYGNSVYKIYGSEKIRICRTGKLPILKSEDKEAFLQSIFKPTNQLLIDGGISSLGDFGYVYGVGTVELTENGKDQIRKASYLRVWKKEGTDKGTEEWKIVLDVLAY